MYFYFYVFLGSFLIMLIFAYSFSTFAVLYRIINKKTINHWPKILPLD